MVLRQQTIKRKIFQQILGPNDCRTGDVNPDGKILFLLNFGSAPAQIPHCCYSLWVLVVNWLFERWDVNYYKNLYRPRRTPCFFNSCMQKDSVSTVQFWKFADHRSNASADVCRSGSFAHPVGLDQFGVSQEGFEFAEEVS